MAFASMGADIVSPSSSGSYCFRIHGQIYHCIRSVHPEAHQSAQYGQLDILDSAQALHERMGNVANNRYDKTIMKKFGDLIKRITHLLPLLR